MEDDQVELDLVYITERIICKYLHNSERRYVALVADTALNTNLT